MGRIIITPNITTTREEAKTLKWGVVILLGRYRSTQWVALRANTLPKKLRYHARAEALASALRILGQPYTHCMYQHSRCIRLIRIKLHDKIG